MDGPFAPLSSARFSAGTRGSSDALLCGHGAAADTGPHVLLGRLPVVVGDFLLNIPWLVPESRCGPLKCIQYTKRFNF